MLTLFTTPNVSLSEVEPKGRQKLQPTVAIDHSIINAVFSYKLYT